MTIVGILDEEVRGTNVRIQVCVCLDDHSIPVRGSSIIDHLNLFVPSML